MRFLAVIFLGAVAAGSVAAQQFSPPKSGASGGGTRIGMFGFGVRTGIDLRGDGQLVFGTHLLPGAHHISDGAAAHAYIRPLDIRIVEPAQANGHSHDATVERVNNLGPVSKVRFRLSDGQPLVGELSNEDLPVLSAGDHVLLDLRNVKVFEGAAEYEPGAIASGTGDDADADA